MNNLPPDPALMRYEMEDREVRRRMANRNIHPLATRCGICDEPIAEDAETCYVDDERCHAECADDA